MKAQLRESLLERRRAFVETSDYDLLSKQITDRILAFLKTNFFQDKLIGCYYPIKGEVDILPIATNSYRIAFPRLKLESSRSAIEFAEITDLADLSAANFNFKQPKLNLPVVIPDIILVPCVGVDKNKHRLGYGYGHFDKYLAAINKSGYTPIKIGVVFDFQVLEKLPSESHDQAMDYLITESQLF